MYSLDMCQSHGLGWIFLMGEYDVDDLHACEKRLCPPRWPPAAGQREDAPGNASLELEWRSQESKSVMRTDLIYFYRSKTQQCQPHVEHPAMDRNRMKESRSVPACCILSTASWPEAGKPSIGSPCYRHSQGSSVLPCRTADSWPSARRELRGRNEMFGFAAASVS